MGKPTFSLPSFVRLAPSIHLQDPNLVRHLHHDQHSTNSVHSSPTITSPTQRCNIPPPDLVILTSWTGAIDRHVAKYTTSYSALFPGIPILVITTAISDLTIHSTKHKIESLAPAVDYLLTRQHPHHGPPMPSLPSVSYSPSTVNPYTGPFFSPIPNPLFSFSPQSLTPPTKPFSSILLHAFSEGGSFAAVSLAKAFLLSSPSQKLPVASFIFDSTPGTATPSLASATTAFQRSCHSSISSPITLKLGGILSYAAFHLSTPREKSWLEQTRQGINDVTLWDIHGVPRTYLFSEKDDLVLWEDVQRHGVESAERYGVKSLMVRFKRTQHCGHARDDDVAAKKVYWAAVRQTWEVTREDGGLGLKLGLGRRVSLDSLCEEG